MINGKDKSIEEQLVILEKILKKNKKLMEILKILEKYKEKNSSFKNYYVAAGSINQTVLNYYHDFKIDYGIKDYDIVYYDEDTSYEKEDVIIKELYKELEKINVEFDIKNQKRVPIWFEEKYNKKREPYTSVENAISRWSSTITCIGIRLENGKIKVVCPYGLNDLFSLIIRPVKIDITKEEYERKSKTWKKKWPKLEIKEWNEEL